ncbi:MAG TPA: isoprenylcysteine carboxylmethyltransferase family protein [Verrucomicrobiae bacterium]|jgi:protein-S-isoprenylcysteine O-methyltransferase Ste14|nr:isoprenylcysteine carboxylmethyltransferase family protein [Verrucomicrobiae bacterium]
MISGWFFEAPWIVFVAYWIFAARNTQRTEKKESFGWRYGIMLVVVLGFVLIFYGDADIGVLGHRVLHRGYYVVVAGIALTWAGIALAIWARVHLGQYWSGRITIKEDHKLISTGPYARLRHPIYSGLDLAVIGAAISIDRWGSVVGVCLVIVGFSIKAKREEAMLTARFGEEFSEHARRTGFLLPKFS